MRRLPRATPRGLSVAGGGLALVVIGALTGFVDLVRAGIFALALVLLALVLVAAIGLAQGEVRIHRRGPEQTMQAGRAGRIFVDSSGVRRAPLAESDLVEPHTFGPLPIRLTDSNRTMYDVQPRHRGRFTSGPSYLETRDPLALAVHRRDVASATHWIVWPHMRETETELPSTPGQGEDSATSAFAAQHGEPGASTRPYVRGDDTRLVHWPATAHRGELIIRQFDPPVDDMVRLVLVGDVTEPGTDDPWEELVSECASLWRAVTVEQRPAELIVDDVPYVRAEEGLDALAVVETSQAPTRFPDVMTWAFVHTSARTLPEPPRHAQARAVVAGEQRELPNLARRLENAGWLTSGLSPDGAQLDESSASRTAFADVEGAA